MRIGIIGSAGRGHTQHKLDAGVYGAVIDKALMLIDGEGVPVVDRRLRSGGAPWGDHVAVQLYRSGLAESLDLCLPCAWDSTRPAFDQSDFCGGMLNDLHAKFSGKLRGEPGSTLIDLQLALEQGARMTLHSGFRARNLRVGDVDWLIAATFGAEEPDSAGTLHTWRNSLARRRTHIQYGTLAVVDH